MTRADTRDRRTVDLEQQAPPGLAELPDDPGEVVCRRLLGQGRALIELGVADRTDHTVYVVATEHCTHLSPAEARAAAGHLVRAADEAEHRGEWARALAGMTGSCVMPRAGGVTPAL